MTRTEFKDWATMATKVFAHDGPVATGTRAFAEALREHDAELADLYVRTAEANEAIRKHLARQR